MGKRLNIALLTTHLDDEFANLVTKGAIRAAKETDTNIVILPGRYIEPKYSDSRRTYFDFQYNTIFSYANSESIDGIVILLGSICNEIDQKKKKAFVDSFKGKPIVTLAASVEGYSSVLFDNKTGLHDGISHIINDHGKKKIGFVAGTVSNNDSVERLNTYKETLAENNIPFDSNLIVYGNFSPYCHDAVEKLLDDNPDIEAVVFANDQMAVCGYDVFKKRNIKIGSDILVMGFDNIPSANMMNPSLSSVQADVCELGYIGVIDCINTIISGKVSTSKISSSFVKRASCGCKTDSDRFLNAVKLKGYNFETAENSAEAVCRYLFDCYNLNDKLQKSVYDFVITFFCLLQEICNGNTYKNKRINDIVNEIQCTLTNILCCELFNRIFVPKIFDTLDYLKIAYENNTDIPYDKKDVINSIIISLYKILSNQVMVYGKTKFDDVKLMEDSSSLIIQSMVSQNGCQDENYAEVIDKLSLLNIKSSYLYAFEPSISHLAKNKWLLPKGINLKAYHHYLDVYSVSKNEQYISINELFSHKYMPYDRSCILVVSPLFSRFEHYGLLICELEQDYFYYIASISSQLCAAMRISALMKNQDMIKTQLEITLNQIKESNMKLDEISKSDELTGIYNRRGFYDMAASALTNPMNNLKKAILIFADLDSLKLINDLFGHDEGDFAITGAASILKDSFRSSDIVGRIGGDEFAVFAITESCSFKKYIKERMNRITDAFNNSHIKPYLIHMSIGIYEFECSPNLSINDIMSKADSLLYEEKKHKKSVLREQQGFRMI
jgi:diguanylate cyclase (GGDEF)-like protein